jgi:hypothetical protein
MLTHAEYTGINQDDAVWTADIVLDHIPIAATGLTPPEGE